MGDGDGVEARDAARPEIGRNDVFAEVELRAAGADGASGIDQQGAALRGDEQGGVAFADVDRSDFQNSGMRVRGGGDECESERGCEDGRESERLRTSGRRRADHMARTSAAAASAITTIDGMATRKSRRTRRAPSPRTVPVMPSRANVVRSTGTLASHGERWIPERARRAAAGIINCVRGTTIRLEGNPMVVARWK